MKDVVDNPWPHMAVQKLIFLLDDSTPLERQILEQWVEDNRPEGMRRGDSFELISLRKASNAFAMESLTDLRRVLQQADDEPYFVPLRVLWLPKPAVANGGLRLRDIVTGDPRAPGKIKQQWIYQRHPSRCRPIAADGAARQELALTMTQMAPDEPANEHDLAAFVRRRAILALERAECAVNGVRYKVPRLVAEEVLARPRFKKAIAEHANRSGRSLASVMGEAEGCLKEMAANHSTFFLDMIASFGRYLYTRGFDRDIQILPADLKRIQQLGKKRPVVYLMTHKSHLDGFTLVTLFYDLNLPPMHVFGGANMNFFGLGAIIRRSGTVFLRRSFGSDQVYKLVFKNYIDYLVEKRFPLLWALEGTRSRTGKLMPPRYGLMNYVVDSYARSATTDVVLMPVSIAYDQVPEMADYIAEQKGERKRPESASWFMQYISGLHNPFGKIHVRFGQGVALSEVLGEPGANLNVSELDIQKLAFQLSVDANNVTPITGTALVTFVLLAQGHKALTVEELAGELQSLMKLIDLLHLPKTEDVSIASLELLNRTLEALAHNGVLSAYKDGIAPIYSIAPDASMAAAYYRNTLVHFLVTSAIADLALVAVAERSPQQALEALHEEALRLRDLLKFDFFFADKEAFIASFEKELTLRSPDWQGALEQGGEAIYAMLWQMQPLLAHGTLRPFLEAYHVAAEALLLQDAQAYDKKQFIKKCTELGKQRVLQKRILSEEAVSTAYFDPAVMLLESRGLIMSDGGELAAKQHNFAADTAELIRRVAFISALAENRRMGLTPAVDSVLTNASPGRAAASQRNTVNVKEG